MDGILFLIDESGTRRFVQIDLEKHGALWEDFYDVLLASSRETEEHISFDMVKEAIGKYNKK